MWDALQPFTQLPVHWHWLAIGILLLIIEVVTMSLNGYFLWFGLAAAVVALMAWLWPAMPWTLQIALFGVLAVAIGLLWWKYQRSRAAIPSGQPHLNQRGAELIGRTFPLHEEIQNGKGKIKVGDSLWLVIGSDLPVGSLVRVIGQQGVLLQVVAAEHVGAP
ncbi:NfeD family protein [Pseudomonas sp. ABC1]|uniref:NfeD family protein n=1 Tax=Pseudomonas sp. ABC1 TaxID=2748080 RepID=UPI0015C369CE|nr:NfeD family protein [Pseudomonas sp. ABC1]QLF93006.1 NfeD family protein [Pseudomonas sp. ABC1]